MTKIQNLNIGIYNFDHCFVFRNSIFGFLSNVTLAIPSIGIL